MKNSKLLTFAVAFLAIVASGSVVGAEKPAGPRGKPALRATEVLVLVSVSAEGTVDVTPDTTYVGAGQKLVLFACCDTLRAKFPKKVALVPEFHCEDGKCTLVGPAVTKPTTAAYTVWGTCNGRPFGKDPILIFIP